MKNIFTWSYGLKSQSFCIPIDGRISVLSFTQFFLHLSPMKRMKKVFVMFLILVITVPDETAHAFSFVPEFISHYNHHNEEHHRLSFIDFVGEHFGGEHHKGSKHHEQDECPTNHDHGLVSLTFVINKKTTFEAVTDDIAFFEERSPVPPYQTFFSEFHSAIWQPPKLS